MNYKENKILGILDFKNYNSIQEKYFDMKHLSSLSTSAVLYIFEELHRNYNVLVNN